MLRPHPHKDSFRRLPGNSKVKARTRAFKARIHKSDKHIRSHNMAISHNKGTNKTQETCKVSRVIRIREIKTSSRTKTSRVIKISSHFNYSKIN